MSTAQDDLLSSIRCLEIAEYWKNKAKFYRDRGVKKMSEPRKLKVVK